MRARLGQVVHYRAPDGCQAAIVTRVITGSPTGSVLLAVLPAGQPGIRWDTAVHGPAPGSPGTWHDAAACDA